MRKRRTGENILIDLTSLLDVTLLVLMVVLVSAQSADATAASDTAEVTAAAEEKAAEAEEMQELYAAQLAVMQDGSFAPVYLTVSVPYEADDPAKRRILLLSSAEGAEAREVADLVAADTEEGYEALRAALTEALEAHPDQTVVLNLAGNEEKILYRDQQRVESLFAELCGTFANARSAVG